MEIKEQEVSYFPKNNPKQKRFVRRNNRNRRKQQNKQAKPKSNQNFVTKVQNVIDQQGDVLHPNNFGMQYLRCCTNPFGDTLNGWSSMGAYMPDGKPDKTRVTLYGAQTINLDTITAGSTSAAIVLTMTPYILTSADANHSACFIMTGGDATDPAVTLTTKTLIAYPAAATMFNTLLPNTTRARMISSGLRVNLAGSAFNKAPGTLTAYFPDSALSVGGAPAINWTYLHLPDRKSVV